MIGNPQPVSPTTLNRTKPKPTDFGEGMYLTDDQSFAAIKACTTPQREAYVYRFEVVDHRMSDLNIYHFYTADLRWLLFIAYNRHKLRYEHAPIFCSSLEKRFRNTDIIIGPTADDRFFSKMNEYIAQTSTDSVINIMSKYRQRRLGHNLILAYMRATNYGNQYTFLTQRACDLLQNTKVKRLQQQERNQSIIISNIRASAMVQAMSDIDYQFPVGQEGYSFELLMQWINKNGFTWDTIPTDDYDLDYDMVHIDDYDWSDDIGR